MIACFITGDGNNRTGWSSAAYDQRVRTAATELHPGRRLALLAEAEAILLGESPVAPIYHMATNELVKPYVRGMYPTALNVHPITYLSIERRQR